MPSSRSTVCATTFASTRRAEHGSPGSPASKSAGEDSLCLARILAGDDRLAQGAHQPLHEGQIVERQQSLGGQLIRTREVGQGGARVRAAGRTGAVRVDRLTTRAVDALGEVQEPAAGGLVNQRGPVAGEAGGRGAVEAVYAGPHGVDEVIDVADPQQVPRRLV